MGFVYRKSKSIAPGVKLNFSKSGLSSISFGRKGARLTFGSKRTTASVGIPGTGMRYQTSSSYRSATSDRADYATAWSNRYVWRFIIVVLGSFLFLGFLFVGNSEWALYTLLTVISICFIMSNKFLSIFRRNQKDANKGIPVQTTTTSLPPSVPQQANGSQSSWTQKLSAEQRNGLIQCDPLLYDAIEFVVQSQQASVTTLQRKLAIGFGRAGRLVDFMYYLGVIGEVTPSQKRPVLISHNCDPSIIALSDIEKLKNAIQRQKESEQLCAVLEIELPNRNRIFNDSIDLINNTKNYEILNGRYDDVVAYYDWAYKAMEAGLKLQLPSDKHIAIAELNNLYNNGCIRICKAIAYSVDTSRKAKNAIQRLDFILRGLRDSDNKNAVTVEINSMIDRLNAIIENRTSR